MADRSYIVCSSQRSGTHLLGDLLRHTELAGRPVEYFMSSGDATWEGTHGYSSRASYLEWVRQQATTPNGVCGLVVMWVHFDRMLQLLRELPGCARLPAPQLLGELFSPPKYIWLRRRDRVAQAVSWAMALQTGIWYVARDSATPPPPPAAEPVFDFDLVDDLYRRILEGETGWAAYFRHHGLRPLELIYEEAVADPAAALREALSFLEIAADFDLSTILPGTAKQANALSREWAAAFRERKEGARE